MALPVPEPGLDDDRSWVIVDEVNELVWPGFDLEPDVHGEIAFGLLPSRLYERVRGMVLKCARAGALRRIPR
jgi:hypothetical protein